MASSVLPGASPAACASRASSSKHQEQGKQKPYRVGTWAPHVRQGQNEVAPWSSESRPARGAAVRMSADNGGANSTATLDVAGACVEPVYRSVPRPKEGDAARQQVRVLFVSEGNVCRSVMAEAVFRSLVEAQGLSDAITCESKAVRDYNLGEGPDPLAVQVAAQCGIKVEETQQARMFRPAEDIVDFDLIVVMDKFNAADVLKEVSVFDTIDPSAKYTSRVRRLGDFCQTRTIGDIDDPLYGNMGGPDELENLSDALTDIQESCLGLLEELKSLGNSELANENHGLRGAVRVWLRQMEDMDWLVPPMLQKRNQ